MLHLYSRLVWLMIDGMPQDQALALLDHWAPPATYFRRPAVREIYPVALAGGCPLTLTGWDPLPEPEFTFDPAERCVRLRFRSVPEGYSFTGLSASEPAGVLISGENVPYRYDSSTRQLTVELPAGEGQRVEIRYSAIEPGRFAPLPLPPRPEEMPAANGLEPESFVPVPFSAAGSLRRFPPAELVRRCCTVRIFPVRLRSGSFTPGGGFRRRCPAGSPVRPAVRRRRWRSVPSNTTMPDGFRRGFRSLPDGRSWCCAGV